MTLGLVGIEAALDGQALPGASAPASTNAMVALLAVFVSMTFAPFCCWNRSLVFALGLLLLECRFLLPSVLFGATYPAEVAFRLAVLTTGWSWKKGAVGNELGTLACLFQCFGGTNQKSDLAIRVVALSSSRQPALATSA